MSTKTTSIMGYKFEINAPYAEGHVCTAAEAQNLNQTRAENIGNNLRNQVKEALSKVGGEFNDEQLAEVRAKIAEYDATYVIELRKAATPRVTDPVEKEARKLAKAGLRDALAASGKLTSKGITAALAGKENTDEGISQDLADKITAKLEELCTKGSKVWKQAEANIKKQNEATAGIIDDLGLSASA